MNFDGKKRKSMLTLIWVTIIVDLGVKGLHLINEVPFKCFFTLKLLKKTISKPKKIFDFRFFMCIFLRLFMSLSRFLSFFFKNFG